MAPILAFLDKGYQVSVVSTCGGKIPIDDGSMADAFRTAEVDEFLSQGVACLRMSRFACRNAE
jgi:hypothetical protein